MGLPRMRGDDPAKKATADDDGVLAPHARG